MIKKQKSRKETWQGMNWIRQEKRLAIYLRDGLSCAWCGGNVESGASLTLDHILPHAKGGSNEATNLVTACQRCNYSRGKRSAPKFATAVAGYINHDVTATDILAHVRNCARRVLPIAEAKTLISRRGSAAKAIQSL